jgi:hypothetical protein
MSYATAPVVRSAPKRGRAGSAYHAAVQAVRQRAMAGEPCHFHNLNPDCPGYWDWTLHHNHRAAFTAHHLVRLMDGGVPVPDPRLMAPAHRSCNAWDGLRHQNHVRRIQRHAIIGARRRQERTSRQW